MTTGNTLRASNPEQSCRRKSNLWVSVFLLAATFLCLSGQVEAANVDLLMVLEKNGTEYTLQHTVSVDSENNTDDTTDAADGKPLSAKITLSPEIEDVEFLFLGPHQRIYRDLYLKGSLPPTVVTINSGSVVIRYQHSLKGKIEPPENDIFAFLLSLVSPAVEFSANVPVAHSATLVLPEELEFSYAEDEPDSASQPRRTISIHTTEEEMFRVPVRYRRADQDRDGIADSVDLCPDSPDAALVDRTGCEPDADADGVTDIIDMCPASSAGATVDDKGCEADADQDGLADRYDQCDDTPAGYSIGENGCSLDSDQDGVADAEDQCPDSEPFEPVSRLGCSLDFDNDGVPNFRDQCNATAYGRSVNALGCEIDTDADGIPDRLDVCASTPARIEVDSSGCALDTDGDAVPDYRDICLTDQAAVQSAGSPQSPSGQFGCAESDAARNGELSEDDHIIVLPGIKFTTDSTLLSIDSRQILDTVARAISHHQPGKFEIAAHTDNVGESLYNLQLSQDRADAVRQYLMVRGVSPNVITSRGYGELLPITNNANEKQRAQNRRVELRKLDE